ncbi:hypothetical protein C0995_001224, partial [Termitomyces sp. Mi166
EYDEPGLVFVPDTGIEEHFINRIVELRHCSCGWQYLVCFCSYGPEHDEWKSGHKLSNKEALNVWLAGNGEGSN